jgi:hypothetical protein
VGTLAEGPGGKSISYSLARKGRFPEQCSPPLSH